MVDHRTNADAIAAVLRAAGVRRAMGIPSGQVLALIEALRRLDQHSVVVNDVALHRPTLDDVFLALTGHAAEEAAAESGTTSKKKVKA